MADNRIAPSWWTPLPALLNRHPKIVHLLEAHGASGPWAFVVLLAEAAAYLHDPGVVKLTWSGYAQDAEIDGGREGVLARLEEMAVMGLVELLEDHPYGFVAKLPNWAEWELRQSGAPKDPTGAERQARYRHKKRAEANGEAE